MKFELNRDHVFLIVLKWIVSTVIWNQGKTNKDMFSFYSCVCSIYTYRISLNYSALELTFNRKGITLCFNSCFYIKDK